MQFARSSQEGPSSQAMRLANMNGNMNGGRIIGRKRNRSQSQQENINPMGMHDGMQVMPPLKRLKTVATLANLQNMKHSKNGNNKNGKAGNGGAGNGTRVFGSNLTNQNTYFLRSRSAAPGAAAPAGKGAALKPKIVVSKPNAGLDSKNLRKQNKKSNKNLKDKSDGGSAIDDDEEEDIDIDVAMRLKQKVLKRGARAPMGQQKKKAGIAAKKAGAAPGPRKQKKKKAQTVNKQSAKTQEPSKSNSTSDAAAKGTSEIAAWDMINIDNDLECVEYCKEIMVHLRMYELQHCNFVNNNFMAKQNDVTDKMRLILLDWLCGVHRKFRLVPRVLYLTINILDRYLSRKQVNRNNLQLLGCACLWIASKYHEIYAPECSDFVYISDGAFTRDDLLKMEIKIMVALSFELTVPTPMTFAQRFIKIGTFVIEKQFIKFAEIMFDRYLSLAAVKTASEGEEGGKDAGAKSKCKAMYIRGICELLNNGFNRSVSKFGELGNNKDSKKKKFGLTVGLQGVRTEMIDHIGNVLHLCDVVKLCRKTIDRNGNDKSKNNSKTKPNASKIAKSQELMDKIQKELSEKYGIRGTRGIEHIIAIKTQMQDVLDKIDILCHLTYYLIEHGLLDYHGGLSRILPSKLAAASLAYALLGCGILHDWPQYLIDATGYKLADLLPIMKRLESVRQNKKHKSIQSKYNREQYGKVAQLNFEKMNLKKYFK